MCIYWLFSRKNDTNAIIQSSRIYKSMDAAFAKRRSFSTILRFNRKKYQILDITKEFLIFFACHLLFTILFVQLHKKILIIWQLFIASWLKEEKTSGSTTSKKLNQLQVLKFTVILLLQNLSLYNNWLLFK